MCVRLFQCIDEAKGGLLSVFTQVMFKGLFYVLVSQLTRDDGLSLHP